MTVPTDSQGNESSLHPAADSTPADASNQSLTGSAYDSTPEDSQWDDPAYVPEREFVLMPLFRRIGEKLGLRKRPAEADYRYETASRQQATDQQPAEVIPEATSWREQSHEDRAFEPVISDERALARHIHVAQTGLAAEPSVADTQSLESIEPATAAPVEQIEPEQQPEPVLQASALPVEAPTVEEPETFEAEAAIAQESVASSPAEVISEELIRDETKWTEAPASIPAQEWHPEPAPVAESSWQSESIAAAQSGLEQVEFARVAEQPLPPATISNEWRTESVTPESETVEAPALQRERAWRESEQPKPAATKVAGPRLISTNSKQKSLPMWKRVDWSQQFTPQRVAILGAAAMAILMVLGISVARRPAGSLLPEQQQVRSIQPGGVTLTTHPRRAMPTVLRQARRQSMAPAPIASRPATRPQRAARYSEPDVVTHYYKKEKPSPTHQSTVAGVPHFSDME